MADRPERFQKELKKNNVDVGKMLTFKCLDGKSKKALDSEKKVLTFALYRNFSEIKYIVEKIKEVAKDGNY